MLWQAYVSGAAGHLNLKAFFLWKGRELEWVEKETVEPTVGEAEAALEYLEEHARRPRRKLRLIGFSRCNGVGTP